LDRDDPRRTQERVNFRIRVPEVRVIDPDGKMVGVMRTEDAIKLAKDQGLDLIEVDPRSKPPVCKILDHGKYKYDKKKEESARRASRHVVEIKEIKLRPKTDDHDIAFKVKNAKKFLDDKHKVKFTVRFRGREITHPEKAREQLDLIWSQISDIAVVESRAAMESRTMTMLVAPR